MLFVLPNSSYSQENQVLTADFNNISFEGFVKEVEKQIPVKFFYKKEWVEEIIINKTYSNTPLEIALNDVINSAGLKFYIIQNNIIITYQYIIKENIIGDKNIQGDSSQYNILSDEIKKKRPNENEDIEFTVYEIGNKGIKHEGIANLSGYIKCYETGKAIPGAVVFVNELHVGASTNQDGYYTLSLPRGEHQLNIQCIGHEETKRNIRLLSDGNFDINLKEKFFAINEVVIFADTKESLNGTHVGLEKMSIKRIKSLPTSLGEVDVIKGTLALPGVQSVGEGSAGINIRGGAADQNLILMYGTPFFSSSHFFGFFSTFNPLIIEKVSLYKGGIPAEYGGRLSSVIDIDVINGNTKKLEAKGGISPVTAQFMIEGPIIKEKTSFVLASRTTYSNWLLGLMDDPELRSSQASFYDINAKITHKINDKNSIQLSGYKGHDNFKFSFDTSYAYNSNVLSLKWIRKPGSKISSIYSVNYSKYDYSIESWAVKQNAFEFNHDIQYYDIKGDIKYNINKKHRLSYGFDLGLYDINPGEIKKNYLESLIIPYDINNEQAIVANIYAEDNFKISPTLSLNIGIRLSSFFQLGGKVIYDYKDNAEKNENNIIDSTYYNKNDIISKYLGPEYRISFNYRTGASSAIKLNYNRTRQYIHLLSNSTAISPSSIWKLSDNYIKPLIGDQLALGYYYNFVNDNYQSSIEVYYKKMQNMLDLKGNSVLIMNDKIESAIISGNGKAYGIEFMIRKNRGRLNGWINYTYSRTFIKSNGKYDNEIINNGDYYSANYDIPHNLNILVNFQYSRRLSISSTFNYSSGRPITYPVAIYEFDDNIVTEYSDRNKYRIPDYIRWDFSITFDPNLKRKKKIRSTYSFSLYNALGRSNPYSVFFKNDNGKIQGYRLSIFDRPIPTITYNFRF